MIYFLTVINARAYRVAVAPVDGSFTVTNNEHAPALVAVMPVDDTLQFFGVSVVIVIFDSRRGAKPNRVATVLLETVTPTFIGACSRDETSKTRSAAEYVLPLTTVGWFAAYQTPAASIAVLLITPVVE